MNSVLSFINIHTHFPRVSSEIISIYNLKPDELPSENPCSSGIHPWHIDETNYSEQLKFLEEKLQKKSVLFLGECGLDKLKCSDFSIHQKVFSAQIDLAVKYKKPMILHCVKAFDETLSLLKSVNFPNKIIFHGFHKSPELALDLTSKGYFISLGKILFTHPEKAKSILKAISVSQLFLETDDSEFTIEEVYTKASELSEIPLETLKGTLQNNFNRIVLP